MSLERARFERLLRWYPKGWRERNGDVLLSAMLDDAERRGRSRPTRAESFSAVAHGLGTRLDRRLALNCAVAALICASLVGIVLAAPGLEGLRDGAAGGELRWVFPVATATVCPALIAAAIVSMARHRGWLSEPRAVLVLAVAVTSVILAGLATLSWSAGFDAANRGVAGGWFSDAWGGLVASGLVLGAASVTLFLTEPLGRTRLHPVIVVIAAASAGALAAPLIGASLLSPYPGAIAAAAVAAVVLLPLPSERAPAPAAVAPPGRGSSTVGDRRLSRVLAVLAAAGGTVGVVYAFSGSRWSPAAIDSTAAMGQGITILLASSLPMLAAIGIVLAARSRLAPAHTWGPCLLVALSLLVIAVGYLHAPNADRMAPALAVGAVLGGAAVAWMAFTRLRGPRAARVSIAVAAGMGCAALLGMLLAPVVALMPLAAAAFAIWGRGQETSASALGHHSLPRVRDGDAHPIPVSQTTTE